ncbi:MAG: hypothetical protein F6K56_31920, partial [Moorea sp. SIO3G5]|nr:hypothetical protein [Moorena sp. SIO3G5]
KAIKTYADTKALLNGSPSEDFSAKNLTVNGVIKPSAGNKENHGILFTKEPGYGSKDAAWIRYYRCGNSGENTTLEIGTSNDCDDHIALMPRKGNVGIGTTNPRAKLSINGGLHVGGDSDPGNNNLLVDGCTTTKELSVSGSLSFDTPTRQIINMCNNNYGIGIQHGTQYFRTDNNFAWYKGGTHDNNELNPGTDGIVQMVIKDCHVGIGTIDPGAKLEVKGNLKLLKGVAVNEFSCDGSLEDNSDCAIPTEKAIKTYADTKALLHGSVNQNFSAKNLTVNGSIQLSCGDAAWIRYYRRGGEREAKTLEIGTSNHCDDHIVLMPGKGNVGIGTSNPTHKFHVLGSDAVGLFQSCTNLAVLKLSTNEGLNNRVEIANKPGGRLSFSTAEACDVFNVTKHANVGIGTTNPGAKLEVNGNLKLQQGVAVNEFSCDGTLEGNSDRAIPTEKAIKTYVDTKTRFSGSASQELSVKNLTVTGAIQLSCGDAAWIRYYRRGCEPEARTLEIGTSNHCHDHIALMPGKGNVGIGTDSPEAKLDVLGKIKGGGVLAGIWAAQPDTDVSITSTGWEYVSDTSVTFTLDRKAIIFCTYSINVQPNGNCKGRNLVATRLVVDGNGCPQSGSHFQPHSPNHPNVNLNGNLVLPLQTGQHTVKLQWKKVGDNVARWTSNPSCLDGFGGGRTLVVMAFYQ